METSHLLSSSFTPIVLISACGLVTPSLYSRLGEILSRIRLIHHQKIELLKTLHEHDAEEQQMLLNLLDTQIEQVTDKAKMIKNGLYCMLAAIASFLFCSVFAGATEINEWVGAAALATGILGVCLFLIGLGWAMRELSLSLTPLQSESEHLKVMTDHYIAKSKRGATFKVARSA